MINLEIPLNKRTKAYRFFEMVPALLSWGSIVLLVGLRLLNPLLAGIYVLIIIVTLLIKAGGIAWHTLQGSRKITLSQKIDWHSRLLDLADPEKAYEHAKNSASKEFGMREHIENLRLISNSTLTYPKP